ncbi:MAG TPA: hypothetical protein VMT00_09795 [Thermoanaerobaculia bacterium]|nr:hypothetical protein [Thermoanaerobaculia bacterium]
MKNERNDPMSVEIEDDCPCCRFMKEELGVIEEVPLRALERNGVAVHDPKTLDDAELHSRLWAIIEALAEMRIFLECTNHLTDRELYERLWADTLHEKLMYSPDDPWSVCQLDFSGSSGEALDHYLMYYADEEARARWAVDFPQDVIPPHVDPPFRRDELLPQPREAMKQPS